MHGKVEHLHEVDDNGYPAGGVTKGRGFEIHWQDGPLMVDGERREPNGAFVEDIVEAAIGRIEFYQETAGGRFRCRENALAITHLQEAGHWLDHRTRDREARRVEGTHEK
jgi:hypothetical protein